MKDAVINLYSDAKKTSVNVRSLEERLNTSSGSFGKIGTRPERRRSFYDKKKKEIRNTVCIKLPKFEVAFKVIFDV